MHWTGKPVRAYSSLEHPSRRLADPSVAVLTSCCNEARNDICLPRGAEARRETARPGVQILRIP